MNAAREVVLRRAMERLAAKASPGMLVFVERSSVEPVAGSIIAPAPCIRCGLKVWWGRATQELFHLHEAEARNVCSPCLEEVLAEEAAR